MSNLFSNMKSDGLEKSEDRLGGFSVHDSGIYLGVIKQMYAGKSPGGAHSITLIAGLEDGKEYRETIYFTTKEGDNFYTKDGKKMPLPGFITVNDLCLIATGKELSEQKTEEKIVKIYNFDEKKEIPTNVPVLVDCIGQKVSLGILRQLVNKEEKGADGKYAPTAEEKEQNIIDKVFHPEFKVTVPEAREAKPGVQAKAEFYDAWEKKNKGNTQDRRKVKDGVGPAATGGPPQAGGTAAPPKGKSLFGK